MPCAIVSPTPQRSGLVVKNGSAACRTTSGPIPLPESRIVTDTHCCRSVLVDSTTAPVPCGMASRAVLKDVGEHQPKLHCVAGNERDGIEVEQVLDSRVGDAAVGRDNLGDQPVQIDHLRLAAGAVFLHGRRAARSVDQPARDVRSIERRLDDGRGHGVELGGVHARPGRERISSALLTIALKALITWCPTADER